VLLAEPGHGNGEHFNTLGDSASFYELKPRPLTDRTIDFGTVRLMARTYLSNTLSEATGHEVEIPSSELFEWLAQMSPAMMTLLRRFYMWTTGVPLADIAAHEGTTRKAIENYIARWTEIIEGVTSSLD
jgi:hypothetical protein